MVNVCQNIPRSAPIADVCQNSGSSRFPNHDAVRLHYDSHYGGSIVGGV